MASLFGAPEDAQRAPSSTYAHGGEADQPVGVLTLDPPSR
jgi:hypothetical protein